MADKSLRRWWLIGLLAPAAAGQTAEQKEMASMKLIIEAIRVLMEKTTGIHKNQTAMFAIVKQLAERVMALEKTKPKPVNGQCPECGTMARKYTETVYGSDGVMTKIRLAPPRIFRCAHCSAAFWQDAEEIKDK